MLFLLANILTVGGSLCLGLGFEGTRPDFVLSVGEKAINYVKSFALAWVKEHVLTSQPLANIDEQWDNIRVSHLQVTRIGYDDSQTVVDLQPDQIYLKMVLQSVVLDGNYELKHLLGTSRGKLKITFDKPGPEWLVSSHLTIDQLIPVPASSNHSCQLTIGGLEVNLQPEDPPDPCSSHSSRLKWLACKALHAPLRAPDALIGLVTKFFGRTVGRKFLKDKLEGVGCSLISTAIKPRVALWLQSLNEHLENATISIPIPGAVNVGIKQHGARTTSNGILSIPISLDFKFEAQEEESKAAVIFQRLSQCPSLNGKTDPVSFKELTKRNMLVVSLSPVMLHSLIGASLVKGLGKINGLTEGVGRYLKITSDCPEICLPDLFGLGPESDARLKQASSGLECEVLGDQENWQEICSSRFHANDSSVHIVLPLKTHCTVKLVDTGEVLDVLRTSVVLTVAINRIRMSNRKIFVDDDAQIMLDVAFNNTELFYESNSTSFAKPAPGQADLPLKTIWNFAKSRVVGLLRDKLSNGMEIAADVGLVTITDAKILSGQEGLDGVDGSLTAVAEFKLTV